MSNLGNKEIMAKNLSYYLNSRGKSQKDIAEIIGVGTSTVNDWLKAKKYPRIDKIELMANYFGILKSDLIEEKTEEHRKMQQKNDTLTDATLKIMGNDKLLSIVDKLCKLDDSQLTLVDAMLDAFSKADK